MTPDVFARQIPNPCVVRSFTHPTRVPVTKQAGIQGTESPRIRVRGDTEHDPRFADSESAPGHWTSLCQMRGGIL